MAAASSFADRGYRASNLGQIVAELSLTKGALYYFFPTKAALAEEVVRLYGARLQELNRATVDACPNHLDAVVEMSYAAARLVHSDPLIRAGTRLLIERDVIDAALPLPFAGWLERVTQILKDGQDRGEVARPVDPRATADTIISFFYGSQTVSHELGDVRRFLRMLDQFWDLLLPTLRPPKQRPTKAGS